MTILLTILHLSTLTLFSGFIFFSFLTISATWLKRRFDLCCSICMLLLKEPVIMVAMQATSDGQATGTSLFNDLLNF